MEDQVQVGGPSEEILKLVFPFLNEQEILYKSDIFNRADLVCKQWNAILKSDDVWRPICDRKIAWHEMVQRNGRARRLESNDPNMMDIEESEFDSSNHMILATQMSKRFVSGRSCRDIYILSERMGGTLLQHKLYGPDHIRPDHAISTGEDNRTLRDRCTQDYQHIILPTITTLRQVFHDPDKATRQNDVADTKRRLLGHARKEKPLLRERPSGLGKDTLAVSMGQTLLAAVTISFKSVGENAFSSPSNDTTSDITIGAIVNGLVALGAGGLSIALDWPINPVDNLSFLIRKLWINQHELDYEWNTTEEERDELWEAAMRKWWGSLADPIRRTLIEIYDEWRSRFTDGDDLPQITNENNIPKKALSFIVEGRYKYFREVLAEKILLKVDPSLFDSILTIYKEQTKAFIDKIYQRYQSVYEGKDPETNAKLLLDIFLEVAPSKRHPSGPDMSVEYCNGLLERMQNDMDRWNQLATSSLSSDETLWNEQTISDMDDLYQKFDTFEYLRSHRNPRNPSKEFDTGLLVERFLRQQLISPSPVCILTSCYTLQNCEKTIKEINNTNDMSQAELAKHQTKIQGMATTYETASKYHHTREHAMLALIPLLPNLSKADAKRLIYALFTKFTSERRQTVVENGLCKEFNTLWANNVPCSSSADLSENLESIREWINGNTFSGSGSHGVRDRLFGLGLPDNIVSAMGEFLVERLYSTSPYDVDDLTYANAMGVLFYMERFCYENPSKASLVFDYLGQAISNATSLFSQFDEDDIAPKQRETFQSVIRRLVSACIRTRALSLAPVLERLYDEIMDPHLPPTFVQFDALIERINDAPRVRPDTSYYFEMRSIDDEI